MFFFFWDLPNPTTAPKNKSIKRTNGMLTIHHRASFPLEPIVIVRNEMKCAR